MYMYYSSAESSSLSSAHDITSICGLYFIINIYAASEALVASKNTIGFGVFLLTIRPWHFPLSYEAVHGLEIGVNEQSQGVINGILKVVSGELDEINLLFSSSA
jgi:hypothetical protein